MSDQEAIQALKDMGCIEDRPFGWFIVSKAPTGKRFPLFVKALKSLGAWSVSTPTSPGRIGVSCGSKPNEIMFRVRDGVTRPEPIGIKVRDQMPTPLKRVMTYSPAYRGAEERLEDGVAILCWNQDENRWCDDNGETAMFAPTVWWPIPIATK